MPMPRRRWVNDICAKLVQPRLARLDDCRPMRDCGAPPPGGVRSKRCRLHGNHAEKIFVLGAFIASTGGCWRRLSSTWRRCSRFQREHVIRAVYHWSTPVFELNDAEHLFMGSFMG